MKEFDEFLSSKKNMSKHTLRSYSYISDFLQYHRVENIENFKKLTLLDFENYFNSLDVQPATYNTRLRNLKVFTAWLLQHDFIEQDLCFQLKPMKEISKDRIALTETERQALLFAAKTLDEKIAIGLLAYLGIRREELTTIKKSDYDGQYLTVLGKGKKRVKLEVPKFLAKMINSYISLRQDNSPYLIVSKVGKHGINSHSVYKRVKRICEDAGIVPDRVEKIAPHSLRRTFACLAVLNNTSPYVVQHMLRHSSFQTTTRYLQSIGNDAANAAIINQPEPSAEALTWKKL